MAMRLDEGARLIIKLLDMTIVGNEAARSARCAFWNATAAYW
jgi:hypothetical protein